MINRGTEFQPGEIALLAGQEVTVLSWDPGYGGWWYIQLPTGGFHYTRLIKKKIIDETNSNRRHSRNNQVEVWKIVLPAATK